MEIFLNEIPEEGLHRSGEFPVSLFDLAENDPIRPTGPISYSVQMYRFEDAVVFSGTLRTTFQLQCATCLEYIDYEANFENWSSDLDLVEDQRSFDLGQVIREDFILDLPASPFCEDLDPERACPKVELLSKFEEEAEEEPEQEDRTDVWDALDDLK